MEDTILLVENERVTALAEAKMLQRGGFAVRTVSGGGEALEAALSDPEIALVLMDLDLGEEMDGTEAARRILHRRELPIVFLSAHTESEYTERAREITNYGYVLKDAGEAVLIESVSMALELHRTRVKLRRRSEAHRRALEQVRFQATMLEAVEEAVIATDTGGTILYMNPYAERLYGWSRDEVNGENIMNVTVPGQSAEQGRQIMEHLSRGERWSGEFYVQNKSGERFLAHVTNSPLRDEEGTLIGIIGISYDLTPQKETEEALRASRDSYRRLYAAMNEGLALLELRYRETGTAADYQVREINPAGEQITGIRNEEMLNERVGEHTPDGRAPYLETLARVAATGEPRQFEAYVPVWNRHFDVSAFSPAAGQVAVLFNDITDRKRAEEALRSSEKRFHDLYDTIRDAIVIVDEERRIQDCNPAFTELFGYGPEEVKGKTTLLLFEEEEGFRRLGREMAEQAEKRDFLHTARYLTKGGRSFVGEKHVHYVRDEEGRITGFIGLIRDVTEKHEAQEQINQLLHEKQMILREVHHRIKNDMFSISSLLSLQASSLDSGEAVQALETAQHRINIMRNLYQTLFTSESFQQVQLDDFLQTIVDNLKESYASYARITLQAEIAQMEVGAKMAFPVGIILNELITNAFKYAFPDGGSGTITAAVQRRGEKSLEIRVEDDGRGLPAEVSEQGSYGFGLTLVDTFTRQHSGELHTEQDGGTRIRALLQMED